ncbi:MAG: phage portal protein [Patescibacteria group bacterium]|nr:phage portal protein [Patescibacteria group bacterium]
MLRYGLFSRDPSVDLANVWAAGRRRHEPQRDTTIYARLLNIGGFGGSKRPTIKPTPANLRMFGKTTFARRAINEIKDRIAMEPWEIAPKAGIKINSELQRQIDVTRRCLEQPNNLDNYRSFVEQCVEDMLVMGAGVYEQQPGGDKNRPVFMWPVDAMSIQIYAHWNGNEKEPRYAQVLGYGNVGGIEGKSLLNREIVYMRINPSTESPFGLGPLEVAFAAINRRLGVADYAGNLSSNAQPENLLTFTRMSQEQQDTIRMFWRNEVEGQGQTPILGIPDGAEAEVLKLRGTDDKALFLEYQNMLAREIATSFDLSPMVAGIERDVNRNTAEVGEDRDWDVAIAPKAHTIAQYVTRDTIERILGFTQIEFRFPGLKRIDKESDAKIYKDEYQNNAITPNEYRERHNMPPLDSEWGDLTYADVQIAQSAARGAAQVDDPDLSSPSGPSKPKSKKGKS